VITEVVVIALYLAAAYVFSKKALAQLKEINRVMLEILVREVTGEEE